MKSTNSSDNNSTWNIRQQYSTLTELLVSGGDERLLLETADGLNKYGSAPTPTPTINYSYTTATTISAGAYAHVQSIYNSLTRIPTDELNAFAKRKYEGFKHILANLYGLEETCRFAFGPSGTDLELAAIWLASGNHMPVHNITVGLNEAGTGIGRIAKGEYYQTQTVFGDRVEPGKKISGCNDLILKHSDVELRDMTGIPKDSATIVSEIQELTKKWNNQRNSILIHIMHQSKTGLINPRVDMVKNVLSNEDSQYTIVVDACQGRITKAQLANYLKNNCCVILTGSKFFGGPAFSGVLVIPDSVRKQVPVSLPSGFSDFFTESEFVDLEKAPSALSLSTNIGLLLRWEAAIYEMKRYFSIPQSARARVFYCFQESVKRFVETSKLFILPGHEEERGWIDGFGFEPESTVSIYLLEIACIGNYGLTPTKALNKKICRLLHSDLSDVAKGGEEWLAKIPIGVGQPLTYPPGGTEYRANLRISVGAPVISEVYFLNDQEIKERFSSELFSFAKKTDLILRSIAAGVL